MNRTGKGGFKPGVSGNPGGRPKALGSLTIESRRYAFSALRTLAKIAKTGRSESARISAAVALLDRGFGKPAQSIDMSLTASVLAKRFSELSDAELLELDARMTMLDSVGDQTELDLRDREEDA